MLKTYSGRKIEQAMVAAINERRDWTSGNTHVEFFPEEDEQVRAISAVYLHGSLIATYHHDTQTVEPDRDTFREWPTATTASRLRALGVHASIKNGRACIDRVEL